MAELPGTFDPSAINDDRELLPDGDHVAQIFESDLVANSSGTGTLAKFGWEIVLGPLSGRKLWSQENVQHDSAQAQEIGQRTLKRICEAAGTGPITNTDALHGKPMVISVVEVPGGTNPKNGKTYGPKNEIKGYKPYRANGAAPTAQVGQTQANPATPAPPVQPSPPAATSQMPWPSRT